MLRTVVKLHCSNSKCQAPNSLSNQLCDRCQTPLIKRYLWAIGEGIKAYQPGDLIAERYLVFRQPQLVLDTKPSLVPSIPEEIPLHIDPYLKLSPYRLHIPQVYGHLTPDNDRHESDIWLLEYGTLSQKIIEQFDSKQLLPPIAQVWQQAKPLRQLNWLWQIAQLWQPLELQGVVSTLIQPALLQVKGAIIHLRELRLDGESPPSLEELINLWLSWHSGATQPVQEFFGQLHSQQQTESLTNPEQLIDLLNKSIDNCRQRQKNTYQIHCATDSGPTRDHNEDACYPPCGKTVSFSGAESALGIVCDGIGGHEGGEIASQLAIEQMRTRVENLPFNNPSPTPEEVIIALENAACRVNDIISQRNDSEQRHERQRMGTTVVMTLAQAQDLYVTHVGDSRVYWVTPDACHQITLDDDVASREVRLGYALYRDAVQYPAAGSLIQALGMNSSANLRPTVQRLIVDEDCVFVLCTDGLSDNDRVEQYWETEILPILHGKKQIAEVSQNLVDLANRKNGHDNVTVALVYCRVKITDKLGKTIIEAPPKEISGSITEQIDPSVVEAPENSSSRLHLRLVMILIGLVSGLLLSYSISTQVKELVDSRLSSFSALISSLLGRLLSQPEQLPESEEIAPTDPPATNPPSAPPQTNAPSQTNIENPVPTEPVTPEQP